MSRGSDPPPSRSSEFERREWENLHVDPDPRRDLGYEPLDLEVIESPTDDRMIVLPVDEQMLREDMFVIVDEEAIQSADEWR